MATGVWPLPDHNDDERELDLLEPSWADFLHGLRTGMRYVRDGSAGHKMRFMSFVQVRQQFDAFRDRYQAGDEAAVIEALRYALAEGVPAPYWLAQEAERRINRVYAEPVTMHTAFGLDSLFPAGGKKAASARALLRHRQRLWHLTSELMHGQGLSLDSALRRVLAAHAFPFSLTVARRLFERQEAIQSLHLGKMRSTVGTQGVSRKRPISRKL